MDYIQRIESKLKAKGITAKKMLLDLGYSDSLISTWKKGSEPSAIKLMKIAEYLELSLDYLLKGEEPVSPSFSHPDELEQKVVALCDELNLKSNVARKMIVESVRVALDEENR